MRSRRILALDVGSAAAFLGVPAVSVSTFLEYGIPRSQLSRRDGKLVWKYQTKNHPKKNHPKTWCLVSYSEKGEYREGEDKMWIFIRSEWIRWKGDIFRKEIEDMWATSGIPQLKMMKMMRIKMRTRMKLRMRVRMRMRIKIRMRISWKRLYRLSPNDKVGI
jgi:hypothetical protein